MPNGPIVSPLRYPGGKAAIASNITNLIQSHYNEPLPIYIEPFSGGAANAIYLALNGFVEKSIINDLDKSIYSFWYSILNNTDNFLKKIIDTPINYDTWLTCKAIHNDKSNYDELDLGFATFFLNRTNRSGIISAGPLGGSDQSGNHKIDCRFNKKNLIKRIEKIANVKAKFEVYNLDVFDLIENIIIPAKDAAFVYYDPPYYRKAKDLYENHFAHQDHVNLKNFINENPHTWIMTYDNCNEIKQIYDTYSIKEFSLNYSAANKRKASELLICSENNVEFKKRVLESFKL